MADEAEDGTEVASRKVVKPAPAPRPHSEVSKKQPTLRSLMGWLSNPDVRAAISSLHRRLRPDKQ